MVDPRSKELENIFSMNLLQQQHQQVFDGSFAKSLSHSPQNHKMLNDAITSSTKESFLSEMPVTTISSSKSPVSLPNDWKNSTTLEQIQMQYHHIMAQMQLGLPSNSSTTHNNHVSINHVSTICAKTVFRA